MASRLKTFVGQSRKRGKGGGDASQLCGYLMKQGDKGLMKSYKRRWFSRKGQKLFYFRGSDSTQAQGFIDLLELGDVWAPETGDREGHWPFIVDVPGRRYQLAAESKPERDAWVDALSSLSTKASSSSSPSSSTATPTTPSVGAASPMTTTASTSTRTTAMQTRKQRPQGMRTSDPSVLQRYEGRGSVRVAQHSGAGGGRITSSPVLSSRATPTTAGRRQLPPLPRPTSEGSAGGHPLVGFGRAHNNDGVVATEGDVDVGDHQTGVVVADDDDHDDDDEHNAFDADDVDGNDTRGSGTATRKVDNDDHGGDDCDDVGDDNVIVVGDDDVEADGDDGSAEDWGLMLNLSYDDVDAEPSATKEADTRSDVATVQSSASQQSATTTSTTGGTSPRRPPLPPTAHAHAPSTTSSTATTTASTTAKKNLPPLPTRPDHLISPRSAVDQSQQRQRRQQQQQHTTSPLRDSFPDIRDRVQETFGVSMDETVAEKPNLRAGEVIKDRFNYANLLLPTHAVKGQIVITNFRLMFVPDDCIAPLGANGRVEDPCVAPSTSIPLTCIRKVTIAKKNKAAKKSSKRGNQHRHSMTSDGVIHGKGTDLRRSSAYERIKIFTKDVRTLVFGFAPRSGACDRFDEAIRIHSPASVTGVFAFAFAQHFDVPKTVLNGWNVYDARTEFARLGVPNALWRLCDANAGFALCDTYPELVAVPSTVSDNDLLTAALFRSRSRFPALSWLHPEHGACLVRCSQPKVGIKRARSFEDEQFLVQIGQTNVDNGSVLHVMDARPRKNAMANTAKGAGFEASANYKNIQLKFLGIENIHVMRHSLDKLHSLCQVNAGDTDWYNAVGSWMGHIRSILKGAVKTAHLLQSGRSVLVHCSDGWDRTPQLTSLAQLLLDPFYRSIYGFQVLIEKEWLSFGHKFAHRSGLYYPWHESEQSPVLQQFIDCVYQILRQHRDAFEFNVDFLHRILELIYSGDSGTFLCNSPFERQQTNLSEKTLSAWTLVDVNHSQWINPTYKPQRYNGMITPCFQLQAMQLWRSYWLRWNSSVLTSSVWDDDDDEDDEDYDDDDELVNHGDEEGVDGDDGHDGTDVQSSAGSHVGDDVTVDDRNVANDSTDDTTSTPDAKPNADRPSLPVDLMTAVRRFHSAHLRRESMSDYAE